MKTILITIATLIITTLSIAQNSTGKTITKNYNYSNFDKLNLSGFNDDITIEVGTAFKVEIVMKQEDEKYLQFNYDEKEHELSIRYKNEESWKDYKERETYKIKISMPEASVIKSTGNSDVTISGIVGRYFRGESTGNGNMICKGTIDELEIEKTGNGDVNAKALIAKKAKINSTGNGDVLVNVTDTITAKNAGNGDVKNIGKAKFDEQSKSIGNGELLNQ